MSTGGDVVVNLCWVHAGNLASKERTERAAHASHGCSIA